MNPYNFVEKGAVAQSLRNTWNKWASTSGFMTVAVSAGRVEIAPANMLVQLLVRLLFLDLIHKIRIDLISYVIYEGKHWNRHKVLLSYTDHYGDESQMRLYLKDPKLFFLSLGKTPPEELLQKG
jgi:hypothetical protein